MNTKKEKKIVLFGSGTIGERALWLYGALNVYCFVDNIKFGSYFCGKRVISFDELIPISGDFHIVISTNYNDADAIGVQLTSAGISFSVYLEDMAEYLLSTIDIMRIKKFKDAYKGDKIFLIGNGPSLTVHDLKKIQENHIKTFACNLIHKLFDKTDWRPDFYCCYENSAIVLSKDFVQHLPITAKFIRKTEDPKLLNLFNNEPIPEDLYFFVTGSSNRVFSSDITQVIYGGNTVMFTMLQIAVYMGFKEIYLLGVENTQPPTVHTKNFIESQAHFYNEDEAELKKRKEILGVSPMDDNWCFYQEMTTANYQTAKAYADDHGIAIFNATRGGKLDVFERVNFDKLF